MLGLALALATGGVAICYALDKKKETAPSESAAVGITPSGGKLNPTVSTTIADKQVMVKQTEGGPRPLTEMDSGNVTIREAPMQTVRQGIVGPLSLPPPIPIMGGKGTSAQKMVSDTTVYSPPIMKQPDERAFVQMGAIRTTGLTKAGIADRITQFGKGILIY